MKHLRTGVINDEKVSLYELEPGDDVHYDPIGEGSVEGCYMPSIIVNSDCSNAKYVLAINDLFRFVL